MIAERLRHPRDRPVDAALARTEHEPRLRQPALPLVDVAVHAPCRVGVIGPHQAIQALGVILGPQNLAVAAVGLAQLAASEPALHPCRANECGRAVVLARVEQGFGKPQASLGADGIAPAVPGQDLRIGHAFLQRRFGVDLEQSLRRPLRVLVDEPRDLGKGGVRARTAVVPPAQDRRTERVAGSPGQAMGPAPVVARPGPEGIHVKRDIRLCHGRRHRWISLRARRCAAEVRRHHYRCDKKRPPHPLRAPQRVTRKSRRSTRSCSHHAANLFSPERQCTTVGACHVPGISDGPDHAVPQWRGG